MDSSAAELPDADQHHDCLAEGRSRSKQSVFVDVLLSGTRTGVKNIYQICTNWLKIKSCGALYRIDDANVSNLILIISALCNNLEHLRLTQ